MAGHWRKLLILGLVLILGFLLLLALTAVLLPKDQVRQAILEQLGQSTGAEVDLGATSLRLLPAPGIRLGPGSLRSRAAAVPGAGDPTAAVTSYELAFERVDVDVAVLPLLRGRVRIDRLAAAGSDLVVAWGSDRLQARDFRLEVRDLAWPAPAGDPAASAVARGRDILPGEAIPEDLTCLLALACREVRIGAVTYTDLRCAGELDTRVLNFPDCTARQSGGRWQASCTLDFDRDPRGELAFEVQADEIPAHDLLAPFSADLAARLACDLSGDATGACRLGGKDTASRTLEVTGTLVGGAGALAASDWLAEARPYLGGHSDLTTVDFGALEHAFRVSQGRYLVQDLLLTGGRTQWRAAGWVGLSGDLELELKVELPPGFTPDLGQWSFLAESLRDETGRIVLGLRLTGRTEHPTIGVDLGALGASLGRE